MPKVIIPIVFQGHTRGVSEVEVPEGTIESCFDAVESEFKGVKELVIDPATGLIHKFVKVTLDGELLDRNAEVLQTRVSAQAEIEVIAAIAGG